MRLYGSEMSPFAQRVLMTVRLKGHEIAVEAPPGGRQNTPEFRAISPAARTPLLEYEPGRYLCESAAIAGYLDETMDGPSVLPADPVERARARAIAALAQHELIGGTRPLMFAVLGLEGAADALGGARAQLDRGFRALAMAREPGHAFAAGDEPGWADCMMAPMLTMVAIVDAAGEGEGEAILPAAPDLAAYLERARGHPVIGRSIAEMERAFARVTGKA